MQGNYFTSHERPHFEMHKFLSRIRKFMSKQTARWGEPDLDLELATAMSDPAVASGKVMWEDKHGIRKGDLGKMS